MLPSRLQASSSPDESVLFTSTPVRLAASGRPEERVRRFEMIAYTGGLMTGITGFDFPVVVDLSGLRIANPSAPILREHDPLRIVGHTEAIENNGSALNVRGLISGSGQDAVEVRETADKGFPWQASIGARIESVRFVQPGQSAEINGRSFDGPLYWVQASTLQEISFVPVGADGATTARVTATASSHLKGSAMTFEEWLKELGIDMASLPEDVLAKRRAEFEKAYGSPPATATATASGSPTGGSTTSPPAVAAHSTQSQTQAPSLSAIQASATQAMRDEAARAAGIRNLCAKYPGVTMQVNGQNVSVEAHAVSQGWTVDATELHLLRHAAPPSPIGFTVRAAKDTSPDRMWQLMAAGLAQTVRRPGHEKEFDARTLQEAHDQYRGRISLGQMLLTAAAHAGERISVGERINSANMTRILKAAFSTYSLPGIFSNNLNKFLLAGFNSVETRWRDIAAIRPVSDFKTITSYRMTGANSWEEVPPSGQVPHGTLGEESFTNRAKQYATLITLPRPDIINDDLGAFSGLPVKMGADANRKLNKVFWTEFLNNAAFFTSGRGNYISGSGTPLSAASLAQARTAYRQIKDPDKNRLALDPKWLLVGTALETTAEELFSSDRFNTGGASSTEKVPDKNVLAGKFRPIVTTYLDDDTIANSSATQWYIGCDPMQLAAIEVCFLDGVETPTIETSEIPNVSYLGVDFLGYWDFGVAKQDYRAVLKSKGAA